MRRTLPLELIWLAKESQISLSASKTTFCLYVTLAEADAQRNKTGTQQCNRGRLGHIGHRIGDAAQCLRPVVGVAWKAVIPENGGNAGHTGEVVADVSYISGNSLGPALMGAIDRSRASTSQRVHGTARRHTPPR